MLHCQACQNNIVFYLSSLDDSIKSLQPTLEDKNIPHKYKDVNNFVNLDILNDILESDNIPVFPDELSSTTATQLNSRIHIISKLLTALSDLTLLNYPLCSKCCHDLNLKLNKYCTSLEVELNNILENKNLLSNLLMNEKMSFRTFVNTLSNNNTLTNKTKVSPSSSSPPSSSSSLSLSSTSPTQNNTAQWTLPSEPSLESTAIPIIEVSSQEFKTISAEQDAVFKTTKKEKENLDLSIFSSPSTTHNAFLSQFLSPSQHLAYQEQCKSLLVTSSEQYELLIDEESQAIEELNELNKELAILEQEEQYLIIYNEYLKNLEKNFILTFIDLQASVKNYISLTHMLRCRIIKQLNIHTSLSLSSPLYDFMQINFSDAIPRISGLRLGRSPEYLVDWHEINLALGQVALLVELLRSSFRMEFSCYTIIPLASYSSIVWTPIRSKQKQILPLTRRGVNYWSNNQFSDGLVCLLQCVKELLLAASEMAEPTLESAFNITKNNRQPHSANNHQHRHHHQHSQQQHPQQQHPQQHHPQTQLQKQATLLAAQQQNVQSKIFPKHSTGQPLPHPQQPETQQSQQPQQLESQQPQQSEPQQSQPISQQPLPQQPLSQQPSQPQQPSQHRRGGISANKAPVQHYTDVEFSGQFSQLNRRLLEKTFGISASTLTSSDRLAFHASIKIVEDKINGISIRYSSDNEVMWTNALRQLVIVLFRLILVSISRG